MANVETEHKAPLAPPESGDSPSASVALNEENLEALLKAVTAPSESASAAAPPAQATRPVASTPPASPRAAAPPVEVALPPATVAHPAEATESAAPPKPQEVSERPAELTGEDRASADLPNVPEVRPQQEPTKDEARKESERLPEPAVREAAPAAESQPEVVSKLALLSSIKQRRAVSVRPEPTNAAAAEPETTAPAPVQERIPQGAATKIPEQHTHPDQPLDPEQPSDPEQRAPEQRAKQVVSEKQPALEKQPQAAKAEPSPQNLRVSQKKTPPAEQKQRNSAEIARGAAPGPASKPVAYSAPSPALSGRTLFTSEEDRDRSDKPKSFATSPAGMTVIGGTVLAIGLTAYLLMGHGKKPAASSPQPAVTASVQPQAVNSPAPASPAPGNSSAEKSPAERPSGIPAASVPSRPEDVKKAEAAKKVEQPLSKADAAQTAKPAGPPPPATPTPLPVDVNTPRTAARTFAPPVAGTRPVDTTIVEAPPSLSAAGPSVPTIAALPARVAPPPQPAASRASAPRQIAVSGKVQATRLSKQITPEYPALAKATRVQGLVRFRATIATDGQIKSLVLLGGPPPLVKGATDAVKQWRYQPTIVDGVPVEVVTDIEVAFTL